MTEGIKIPVGRVVSVAWRLPFLHWRAMIRILWLPLLLLIALDFAIAQTDPFDLPSTETSSTFEEEWVSVDPSTETPDGYRRYIDKHGNNFISRLPEGSLADDQIVIAGSMEVNFLLELLRLAILAPIMVAWHRAVRPSPGASLPVGAMPLRLGGPEFRYLGFGALLAVTTMVLSLLFRFPVGLLNADMWLVEWLVDGSWLWPALILVSTLTLIPASYPAMRLSPILPLRAVGDLRPLDDFWRMTRGNGWRLVLAMGLTGLPLGYLALIARFNAGFSTAGPGLFFEVGAIVLLPAFGIVAASCLTATTHFLDAGPDGEFARDDPDSRLPVWPTITDAFGFLFANWRTALRLGWIAVLVSFVLDQLFDLIPDYGLIAEALIGFVEMAAYVPAIAIAVVPWHRMILLRQQPDGVRLGARERRYILRTVLLSAICLGIIWAAYLPIGVFFNPAATDSVGTVPAPLHLLSRVGYFAAFTGFLLLSPILPAVAVDGPAGLKRAFALSEGNRLRFVVVSIAVWVPSMLFLGALPETVFDGRWAYLLDLIYNTVYVFDAMIAATALSLCYHRLGGMDDADPVSKDTG